jgi:hypothetical protein
MRAFALGFGTDEAYTSGARVEVGQALDAGSAGAAASLFPFRRSDPACYSVSVALTDLLYTPRNIETAAVQRVDRPYGAWLFASYAIAKSERSDDPAWADSLAIDVGLLGPGAAGRWVQDTVHDLFNIPSRIGQPYKKPLGWHHQLRNEPGINIRFMRRQRWQADVAGSRNWDVLWHSGAAAGNMYTWGQLGGTARLGWNVPSDLGPQAKIPAPVPPRAVPAAVPASPGTLPAASPVTRPPPRDWLAYGFVGVEGRLVVRNAFLDGNFFATNRPDMGMVQKRPVVGDLDWGVVAGWRFLRVTYHNVLRTSEFKRPRGVPQAVVPNTAHRFGSWSVSVGKIL